MSLLRLSYMFRCDKLKGDKVDSNRVQLHTHTNTHRSNVYLFNQCYQLFGMYQLLQKNNNIYKDKLPFMLNITWHSKLAVILTTDTFSFQDLWYFGCSKNFCLTVDSLKFIKKSSSNKKLIKTNPLYVHKLCYVAHISYILNQVPSKATFIKPLKYMLMLRNM